MKKMKSVLAILLSVLMLASCFVPAYAAENEEKEPNNTTDTATAINVDKKIEGSLGNAEDTDYFVFNAEKTGLASIKFEHSAVTEADVTYFTITVYNAATGAAVSEFTSAGNSASDKVSLIVLKDETYFIAVKKGMVYDSAVGYALTISVDQSVLAESEPNNTIDTADPFTLSTEGAAKNYYGSISSATDKDYYRVTVPSSGVINLYLYNEFSPKGNFTVTLRSFEEGADGVQVAEVVTSIAVSNIEATKIGPSVCIAPGDYILEIKGDAGSYRTRILFRNFSNIETENNNSTLQADDITIGTEYNATLDEKSDRDYFAFTVPAENYGYNINFSAACNAKWSVRLLSSDNVVVAGPLSVTTTTSSKSDKLETNALAAGTYYIEVTAGDKHESDIYKIMVTARPKPEEPEKEKNLWDRIKDLDWGGLWDNFSGWIEEINILGMLVSIFASLGRILELLG